MSITLLVLFMAFFAAQSVAGLHQYNSDSRDHGQPTVTYGRYLRTPDFLEATAENWESEFLQMAAYVAFTAFLFQKGSAESKDPDASDNPLDRHPDPNRPGAPAPVKRGGVALALYRNSLAIVLFVLFALSFALHATGGAGEYNREQAAHGHTDRVSVVGYMATSSFWFESFQNWQSEFLAVFAIVVLSIFLRQQGSPESKPVDAPNSQTGG